MSRAKDNREDKENVGKKRMSVSKMRTFQPLTPRRSPRTNGVQKTALPLLREVTVVVKRLKLENGVVVSGSEKKIKKDLNPAPATNWNPKRVPIVLLERLTIKDDVVVKESELDLKKKAEVNGTPRRQSPRITEAKKASAGKRDYPTPPKNSTTTGSASLIKKSKGEGDDDAVSTSKKVRVKKGWTKPNYMDKIWFTKNVMKCHVCRKFYGTVGEAQKCFRSHEDGLMCYICFFVVRGEGEHATSKLYDHFKSCHPKGNKKHQLKCDYCDKNVFFKAVSGHVISEHFKDALKTGPYLKPSTCNSRSGKPRALMKNIARLYCV